MSGLSVLPRRVRSDDHLDSDLLERLAVTCLEGLAMIAHERGQSRRAALLLDAVMLLQDEREPAESALLSVREWQVAALVARGLSNRQIGAELIVSDRTVDTHVSNILRKLSLGTRAQIAAWVVQHGLHAAPVSGQSA